MSKFTAEQQLDVLWKALQNDGFWMSVDSAGNLVRCLANTAKIGPVLDVMFGTRDECIAQLLATQVAARLDDNPVPNPNWRDDESDQFSLS